MNQAFLNAGSFNQDISNWDLSNVSSMSEAFLNTSSMSNENKCSIYNSFNSFSGWENAGATNWDQFCQ